MDRVGLLMNVLSAGVVLTADWIALSSVWTLVNTWGDLFSAAENTALEYFCAMVLAARRPRPAERAAERAEAANMAESREVVWKEWSSSWKRCCSSSDACSSLCRSIP